MCVDFSLCVRIGLKKEKERVEEEAKKADALVTSLKSRLGVAESRADENEGKRKELQKRTDELSIQGKRSIQACDGCG